MRRDLGHASAAAMFALNDILTLSAEVAVDSNPDTRLSAWLGNALVGAIYTLVPGLDIDLGYQASVRTRETSRAWLFGITYRFAP